MDLNEIAVFVKVVEAGSFNKAARLLEMPKSTVSAKVLALEKRLGSTLLNRTTRKQHLTQTGLAFFEKASTILRDLQSAETEVTQGQTSPRGLLKITAPTILGTRLLSDVIARYLESHPQVRIELFLTDQRVDMVAEGMDLALRAGHLSDSSLIAKKIGMSRFAPHAGKNYLKRRGLPRTPEDLQKHDCIMYPPLGRDTWNLVKTPKGKTKVRLSGVVIADDLAFVREMVAADVGIALLPTFFCTNEDPFVRILPDWNSEAHPVQFVHPAQRFTNPTLRSFIDFAHAHIQRKLAAG